VLHVCSSGLPSSSSRRTRPVFPPPTLFPFRQRSLIQGHTGPAPPLSACFELTSATTKGRPKHYTPSSLCTGDFFHTATHRKLLNIFLGRPNSLIYHTQGPLHAAACLRVLALSEGLPEVLSSSSAIPALVDGLKSGTPLMKSICGGEWAKPSSLRVGLDGGKRILRERGIELEERREKIAFFF